jgi:glycosyltransferase involved in cell wall biosynthesis
MKLTFISKYPPIEGYVSSSTYWLARGLSKKGHTLTVVTNAFEVESQNREEFHGDDLALYQTEKVRVRNTDPFQDYHLIPNANPFCEKLASAALEGIDGARLVDSWYFASYGTAGMLVSAAAGLPLVVRHAGSDLGRLAENHHMRPLLCAMLRKASAVVAQRGAARKLRALGARPGTLFEIPVSVDTEAFHPKVKPAKLGTPPGVPVITYIGKLTRGKGVIELLRAASRVQDDFRLLLVSSGAAEFVKGLRLHSRLRKRIIAMPFVPPWRMPGILTASRCLVMPEHDFPVRSHVPILPREALAAGTCLVVSGELHLKVAGGKLRDGENALVVDPKGADNFAAGLRGIIRDEKLSRRLGIAGNRLSSGLEDFKGYVSANERMYRKIAG